MRGYQNTIIVGNLTRDPHIADKWGGITIAVNGKKANGEDFVDYISVKFFGKTLEYFPRSLTKGAPVMVIAKISTSKYEDKYQTDVIAQSIHPLVGRADDGERASQGQPWQQKSPSAKTDFGDFEVLSSSPVGQGEVEIPF